MRPTLLASLLFLFPCTALADLAPDPAGAGANLGPMDESAAGAVSMESEEVSIELHPSFAVIDATFVLANSGLATTLDVGFPGEGVRIAVGRFSAHRALVGFKTWVNGVSCAAIARKVQMGAEGPKTWTETWHVFGIAVPAAGKTTVRVRYGVPADVYFGDSYNTEDTFPDSAVSYILATGARWKGAIGKATFTIRGMDGVSIDGVRVRDDRMPAAPRSGTEPAQAMLPTYGKRADGAIVLSREAFEPAGPDDLQILFQPPGAGDRTGREALDAGRNVDENAILEAVAKE
ncbi:MAG: hypothetical protein HY720_29740 [Planctomycetes bacterium]|nr:hypothetical protein [Planctomycetota bacterium]